MSATGDEENTALHMRTAEADGSLTGVVHQVYETSLTGPYDFDVMVEMGKDAGHKLKAKAGPGFKSMMKDVEKAAVKLLAARQWRSQGPATLGRCPGFPHATANSA
ncbi:hypothetical protein E2562_010831 [Oryza meyeriana var. granulata]|uniref:Uncharacterized protein n=1 Tax=Oryza meyeriana var. granulata TaxID=110450 RepID=A0A6G1BJ98_9ORYZ|nr:hypothetical protein E2562_010831 [Oryza meyeriana var. granulata]